MIETVWGVITSNKKAVLAALVSIALVYGAFCVKDWYDTQITASYNHGVTVTDQKWDKANAEKEKKTQAFKDEQLAIKENLEKQLADALRKAQNPQTNGGEKKDEYIKKPVSKEKVLDDDFVEIYNDSIGAK